MNRKKENNSIKKVVLYLRFSCSKQNETSIEGQRKVCLDFAKSNNFEIVGEYVDREKSASKDIEKRTAFLQMIDDGKQNKYDAVLVYKMDRFSRNTYETAYYMHILEEKGISVYTAIEGGNGDTPEDRLIRQVMIGFSAYYSEELSQKVIRGMRVIASKGLVPGGVRIYGYNIVSKKYVPNEQEAPIVKEIFARVLQGEGIKQIADSLNERGIFYKTKKFTVQNIWQLLTFRTYLGEINFQDISVKNAHEPLVSYEDFEKVQNRPKHIRSTKFDDYKRPLFSGRIYCGECGHKLKGTSGTRRDGKTAYYYKCTGKEKCGLPYISREELNSEITNLLFDIFYNEVFFKDVIKEAKKIVHENIKALNSLIKKNEDEIIKTKNEIANLIMYSGEEDLNEILKGKIDEKKKHLKYLEGQKDEYEKKKFLNDEICDKYQKKIGLNKKRFDQNIAQANYSFFVSQTNKKDYKRYDLFEQMSVKIFAELVEKIIVFKDKTVTLVLKIDKDLNSYFDEKSIDLSNFTLILPPKSLKFEESKRKIKISPDEETSKGDSIDASDNKGMCQLNNWP